MASAIIDGTNIDLSVFSYSAPKPNPTGGKVVNLYNKNLKEYLTMSAPLIGSWGAQVVKALDGAGTSKYTMTLQFAKEQYATPDTDKFLEQMKLVEQKIKQDAMVYSKDWFGKEIKSMDVMDEKFTPMLKYPKMNKTSEERDYSQPPQLTVKLPCWKDVWQTSVFDEDYNQLYVKGKTESGVTPLDFLRSTTKAPVQVICLIQSAGIWFVGNPAKVSITWNLKQVIVRRPKVSAIADDTCFLTIRPADREALKALPETEVEHHEQDHVTTALVEDSDDEKAYNLPPPTAYAQAQVVEPVVVEAQVVEKDVVASAPVEEVVEKKKTVVKKIVKKA